jgi:hypothetical protein
LKSIFIAAQEKESVMPFLNKRYQRFDKDDVRLMIDMMKKFHELHGETGMPDYSNTYVAYLPVFAIALLASQESVERLTKVLIAFTVVISVLTLILAIPILVSLCDTLFHALSGL